MEAGIETERLGLALSGGGFRAAFFHVGVLARLAETGVLPEVEVISTVSGGSIVGAAYYLRLKRLLDEARARSRTGLRRDRRGGRALCGRRCGEHPRAGLRNLGKNITMACRGTRAATGSATSTTVTSTSRPGARTGPQAMHARADESRSRCASCRSTRRAQAASSLTRTTRPKREGAGPADQRHHPQHRATTGASRRYGWASRCPRTTAPEVVKEVDKNRRLAQGYFEKGGRRACPEAQRGFPLGLAVAASAGVPGVFPPLAISGMYGGVRVQLVDGGVQDNQGIQGLLRPRMPPPHSQRRLGSARGRA